MNLDGAIVNSAEQPRKLSVPTMIAFGSGEMASAFLNMAWGVLLLFYYQQVVGVEAALVGLAIAISVLLDAITDPLIGTWSDRLNTRWGRRHPMLLAAALPLAVSFVLLFAPPDDMTDLQGFLWLMTFAVLVRVSYTFYNIPHLALGAEMVQDYYQRSTLFAFAAFIGAISVATSYGLITGFYFPTIAGVYDPGFLNPDGYPIMSRTYAVVMVVAILICVLGTRKEIPYLREAQIREPVGLFTMFLEIWEVLKNRSFRAVFFGLLLGSIVAGVEAAFQPFMGIHFWGLTTEDLFYMAYLGLLFPVSFVLIPTLTRLFDKRYTIMVPLACWITAVNLPICLRLMEVPWFPDNDSPWVLRIFLTAAGVGALAAPIIGASANSMLADVADEHELDTGIRREGVLYSVRAFSQKATAAFGTLFGGILLSVIEFPEQATRGTVPPETVWYLGLIAGPATSVFSILALGFYFKYEISFKRHREIMVDLEKRRVAVPSTASTRPG